MNDDDKRPPGHTGAEATDAEETELDLDAPQDLAAAVREALAAVEGEGGEDATEHADVERLQAEISDLKDRTLRTLADFDNYRKRVEREREEHRRYAAFEVLRGFLEVLDNLERTAGADGSVEDLKQGVGLIIRQAHELLRRHGVERVAAAGERFDPAVHDAVAQHSDPAVEEPTVARELQSGYRMHERLIRPAVVEVAMPTSGSSQVESTGENAATDSGS